MASEADIANNQEKPVYRKMMEYKKKIALVEGKRRALFSKCEKEKNFNKGEINNSLFKNSNSPLFTFSNRKRSYRFAW